jgi:hypothetical protein
VTETTTTPTTTDNGAAPGTRRTGLIGRLLKLVYGR